MSDSFSDERADMASKTHYVDAQQGVKVELVRNDMYIKVRDGAGAISITTTPPSSVPIGLCMTFDNSGGSGTLNVNSGEVQVPPGLVYEAKVVGDGSGGHALVVVGPSETPNTLTTVSLLQSALDSDKENGRLLELQGGETTLTTTLVIDGGTGGAIYGQGVSNVASQSNSAMRQNSTFIYTGAKTGSSAAIQYERAEFGMYNFVLQGRTSAELAADTGTNTPIGINIVHDASPGIPTGRIDLGNVRLSGFDLAIKCGQDINDSHCDESHWRRLSINKCGTGFQCNNIQGLTHKFYDLRVSLTDVVFQYFAGGKLSVTDVFIGSETTLLKLMNDTPSGYGHNASRWEFRGVELDSQAINSYLLYTEPDCNIYGHVVFNGVHLAMNGSDVWDHPGIHVGDNMTVVVNDIFNLPANFVSWDTSSNTSTIIFNNPKVYTNVTTAADVFKTSGSSGNLRCIVNTGVQHNTYAVLGVTPDSGTTYNQVLTGV